MSEIDLEALAERVEALEGPDRHVDWDIASSLGLVSGSRPPIWGDVDQIIFSHHPRYTASIDSAMSLVPEGMDWIIDNFDGPVGRRCSASINSPVKGWSECHAATPALALTAAALKARAALSRLYPPNEVKHGA